MIDFPLGAEGTCVLQQNIDVCAAGTCNPHEMGIDWRTGDVYLGAVLMLAKYVYQA